MLNIIKIFQEGVFLFSDGTWYTVLKIKMIVLGFPETQYFVLVKYTVLHGSPLFKANKLVEGAQLPNWGTENSLEIMFLIIYFILFSRMFTWNSTFIYYSAVHLMML